MDGGTTDIILYALLLLFTIILLLIAIYKCYDQSKDKKRLTEQDVAASEKKLALLSSEAKTLREQNGLLENKIKKLELENEKLLKSEGFLKGELSRTKTLCNASLTEGHKLRSEYDALYCEHQALVKDFEELRLSYEAYQELSDGLVKKLSAINKYVSTEDRSEESQENAKKIVPESQMQESSVSGCGNQVNNDIS